MRKAIVIGTLAVLALALVGCGGSSSGTSTSSGATINSLGEVPSVDTMVQGGATTAASLSAPTSKAVVDPGSAPLVRAITPTTAKTLFWKSSTTPSGNLVDDIIADPSLASTQQENFWRGEGSCRLTQMVGYAVQNLKDAGTSTCYMKYMPDAIGADNITAAEGSTPITTPSTTFNKQSSDFIMKVNAQNSPGESGDQIVYIKVYKDAGYNVDLWFCSDTTSTPHGYEQLRYNATTGALTQTNVETGFGTFYSTFSATVTADSNGSPIFDSASDRSVTAIYNGTRGSETFTDKTEITVSGNLLSAMNYSSDTNGTWKNFAVAQYIGNTFDDLRFTQGGFMGENNFGEFTGGTEFQTNHYEGLSSFSSLTNTELASAADGFTFSENSFFASAPSLSDIPTGNLSDYSCNPTVNYTVTMDFNDSAVAAIQTLCENNWSDMNFCDDPTIRSAREVLYMAPH